MSTRVTKPSRVGVVSGAVLLLVKLAAVALSPGTQAAGVAGLMPHIVVLVTAMALLGGRPRRAWARAVLLLWAWVMIAFIGLVAWVDLDLAGRAHVGVVDEPRKVWSARGLISDGGDGVPARERNSIEAVAEAFDRGAVGCEVDVYFDPDLGVFVCSHGGPPYERPGGELLTLERLLDAVGDQGLFWLDWKKLRHLDEPDLVAAIARLERLCEGNDRRARLYVEGEAPHVLARVARAGFLTILDSHPPDDGVLSPLAGDLYKLVYALGGFAVMGMRSGTAEVPIYGSAMRRALGPVPMFLYHVPDDAAFMQALVDDADARVVLPDDHHIDVFDVVPRER